MVGPGGDAWEKVLLDEELHAHKNLMMLKSRVFSEAMRTVDTNEYSLEELMQIYRNHLANVLCKEYLDAKMPMNLLKNQHSYKVKTGMIRKLKKKKVRDNQYREMKQDPLKNRKGSEEKQHESDASDSVFNISNDTDSDTEPKLDQNKTLTLRCPCQECQYKTSNMDSFVQHVNMHVPDLNISASRGKEELGNVETRDRNEIDKNISYPSPSGCPTSSAPTMHVESHASGKSSPNEEKSVNTTAHALHPIIDVGVCDWPRRLRVARTTHKHTQKPRGKKHLSTRPSGY